MRRARPIAGGRGEDRGDVEQALDLELVGVGQFIAVGAEQLDAVVVERVVAGRDHDAEVGAHRAGQHRDGGRRHRPDLDDVHADAGEARGQRAFDHVARQPRVLADQDAVLVRAAQELRARRLADAHRHLGRHRRGVGQAANAVGAEKPARHGRSPRAVIPSPVARRQGGTGACRPRSIARSARPGPRSPARRGRRRGQDRRSPPRGRSRRWRSRPRRSRRRRRRRT